MEGISNPSECGEWGENNELLKLRQEIDYIDGDITKLFERRMELVLRVSEYKRENNLPIFYKDRENEVIKKNIERLGIKEFSSDLEVLFKCIMELSRDIQKRNI